MKNYIILVNDHSGSMEKHALAAVSDYNATIKSIRDAASAEMLDTVVSVIGVGIPNRADRSEVTREVVISNPHVLKNRNHWQITGGTPLFDGIGDAIDLAQSLPDYDDPNVSFLVQVTTDGDEQHSMKYHIRSLREKIAACHRDGRWTFVARVPKDTNNKLPDVGFLADNIQTWDTTDRQGMTATTQANASAMSSYFRARSAGAKSSSSFYANASQVNVAALNDVSKEISLYVVPDADNGIEIRPFVLRHRMEMLKGSAFYQLTKTEAKVGYDKQVLVRDRATGKFFAGKEARQMIGLPTDRNARLHPGDHKNFDLFIQSFSVNRKLVGGTGLAYWAKIGTQFTDADLAYLQPKQQPAVKAAGPIVLPAVPVSTTPTKSPIPVTPKAPSVRYFSTREDARVYAGSIGVPQSSIKKNVLSIRKDTRWYL